jgi:hypothetical protein
MRSVMIIATCAALSACAGYGPSGGLVGTQSPPNPYATNAEPQPPGSIPVGAGGVGASGPNARYPDYATIRFGTPY